MAPFITPDNAVFSPGVLIPVFVASILIALAGALVRLFLAASLDEIVEMVRQFGPIAAYRARRLRPGPPVTPWFCDRCTSLNGESASRCYKCDARRTEHEAPVPDAEAPAGAGAGLAQRTRR
ncbi:MAG: hypothetical protein WCK58_12320 [Chloroflexota bacterium]